MPVYGAKQGENAIVLDGFLISGEEDREEKWIPNGVKHISANIVRELARLASVHIYCDSDDVLYANNSYITFHAATTGKKKITLPAPATLKEVYTGKIYAENSAVCEFDILKGETLMFEII